MVPQSHTLFMFLFFFQILYLFFVIINYCYIYFVLNSYPQLIVILAQIKHFVPPRSLIRILTPLLVHKWQKICTLFMTTNKH